MKKQIGDFTITATGPYPVWITIKNDRQELRIHHTDLLDLRYAVDCLIQDAAKRLKTEPEKIATE